MNHQIRDAKNLESKTPEPVITIQTGNARVHCNSVEIVGKVTVKFGRLRAHGHDVRAWVETDNKNIRKIG
jgi:hypothetical protein